AASRIEEAVRRVLVAKAKAGLHADRIAPGWESAAPHGRLATEVMEAAVTLARDGQRLVPLPASVERILHVTYSLAGNPFGARAFNAALTSRGLAVTALEIRSDSRAPDYRRLREAAAEADLVLLSAN